jgi:hypothetical protein
VDKAEAPKAVESTPEAPKAETKAGERQRNPDGTFKPSDASETKPLEAVKDAVEPPKPEAKPLTNFVEPPPRFSPDAKAAWKDAPEPVRAEIHRAVREMEQGIERYRSDATAFAELKPFDDLAKQHGTSIKTTMENYIRLSRTLQSDNPMPAIEELLGHAKMSVRDFAAKVMGQKPEEATSALESRNRQLEQRIVQLEGRVEKEVGEVKKTFQTQREAETTKVVEAFAKEHTRFDELSEEIAGQIKLGYELSEAYRRAELLKPAPPPPQAASAAALVPEADQTRDKGKLSVTGAPSSGSDPLNRKPPSTRKEAIDRAFDSVGL